MKTEPIVNQVSGEEESPSDGKCSYITYSDREMEIVKNGLAAIKEVLMGADMEGKDRLLFCLDRFLDPWFGYELPDRGGIVTLLQTVVVSQNSISVKEAALQLLCDYAWPPFPILEENFDAVEAELKQEVMYAVNMGQE